MGQQPHYSGIFRPPRSRPLEYRDNDSPSPCIRAAALMKRLLREALRRISGKGPRKAPSHYVRSLLGSSRMVGVDVGARKAFRLTGGPLTVRSSSTRSSRIPSRWHGYGHITPPASIRSCTASWVMLFRGPADRGLFTGRTSPPALRSSRQTKP